ncbi:MAG: gliding motility-associated ABC transporter permease subunit GldF [Flavobacteriaceae bacterium CG_4_8_14_3_um_filter_34_10]|nr:gliding motility-associated ABC transporter permease subunit GldF [Flavobacteriia bacterium]OIP49646.1 MAG: gliding motility-associated ABC transporter permease subunit GldF [Flavobacteriaceae bacterium CG2_30_34_30]PIQ19161.1 MAG: gliding motility-associated ABC transporter permease subunit GldF [Flavobacteriaceae bacterium CG18_big_fil_WC_8_21_14_2_50_34_36]PIV48382.1 MAG: gliding motility-associated ABC transporter permease subunit GldF [Flavobacteriaceae bacterium CG02_land_8_20_14_3_00_3
MIAIIKREINSFFASPIGYLVIGIFLVVNGLFLWVFKEPFNILDAGFADLTFFFQLAPWIFILLIPAVTMRSFSDEKKMGTLELLLTKPIAIRSIVLGKYVGAFILILLALIPTLLYVVTISQLAQPSGNWDVGSTVGAYIGLLFLVTSYTAIGIFASTLSENQIVAFIIGVFLCFFMYYGFEGLANYSLFGTHDYFISKLGMQAHFNSIARGVFDTRDGVYFFSIALFFLGLTIFKLQKK